MQINLDISIIFRNFATRYRSGFDHKMNLIFRPLKTCKIMNKTFRKILQAISYIIDVLLGIWKGEKEEEVK